MADSGGDRGVEEILNNHNFDFLNLITNDDYEDSDPDFTMSPYTNLSINCSYSDLLNLKTNSDILNVLSLNIQSLPAKFNEFLDFLEELKNKNNSPDVVCLQEIWQTDNENLFKIAGYHLPIFKNRTLHKGGGVAIYIKSSLTYKILPELSIFSERIFESLFIESITKDNKSIAIGTVYRPGTPVPGMNFTEQFTNFAELLTHTLNGLNDNYEKSYIYGDINLDVLKVKQNKFISEYIDTLCAFGFLQIVTKPTRITKESATIIDHILTNNPQDGDSIAILCNTVSDHLPILHCIDLQTDKIKPPSEYVTRDFSAQKFLSFNNALSSFTWNHTLTIQDTQLAYDAFNATFTDLYNTYFPPITKNLIKGM